MTAPGLSLPDGAEVMDEAMLARLGILRVPTERFEVGPYRYANLADALAEAGRLRAASGKR